MKTSWIIFLLFFWNGIVITISHHHRNHTIGKSTYIHSSMQCSQFFLVFWLLFLVQKPKLHYHYYLLFCSRWYWYWWWCCCVEKVVVFWSDHDDLESWKWTWSYTNNTVTPTFLACCSVSYYLSVDYYYHVFYWCTYTILIYHYSPILSNNHNEIVAFLLL